AEIELDAGVGGGISAIGAGGVPVQVDAEALVVVLRADLHSVHDHRAVGDGERGRRGVPIDKGASHRGNAAVGGGEGRDVGARRSIGRLASNRRGSAAGAAGARRAAAGAGRTTGVAGAAGAAAAVARGAA